MLLQLSCWSTHLSSETIASRDPPSDGLPGVRLNSERTMTGRLPLVSAGPRHTSSETQLQRGGGCVPKNHQLTVTADLVPTVLSTISRVMEYRICGASPPQCHVSPVRDPGPEW